MTSKSRVARRTFAILHSTACNVPASNCALCQQGPASHEGSPEIPKGSPEIPEGSPEIPEGSNNSEGSPRDKDFSGLTEPSEPRSEDERLRRSDDQKEDEDEAPEEGEEEEADESNRECEGREVNLAQTACKQLHSTEILLLELLRKQRASRCCDTGDGFSLGDGFSEQVRDYIRLCVKQEAVEGCMERARVFRFQYGLKKTFLLEASMTPFEAPFFAVGIGFERRLALLDRNESEMVDVRRTMPMLLHLRCGDKLQIKANKRSYGFLLLWCRGKPAHIAINVAHPVDPKLLSSRSGRRAQVAGLACIQKQLTSIQETQSDLIDELLIMQQKVDTSCQLYTTLQRMVDQSGSQQQGQQSQAPPQLGYQVPFVVQPPR